MDALRTHEPRDITIIGGGPTGLFAMFYAGMRGATARIVDALPELGGQLTALYPEKYIFNVAGFPKVLSKDLVRSLVEQAAQFAQPVYLHQRVHSLVEEDGGVLTVVTDTDRFPSRAVIIAAGIGAFSPRRLPQPAAEPWYGRGIHETVTDPEAFRDRRVVIIGGGDSAFDWAMQLAPRARFVTLAHRSDRYRAHAATVRALHAAAAAGRAEILPFHELAGIAHDGRGDRLTGVVLTDTKRKTTREVPADDVLPMLGYVSDVGPLAAWGLTIEDDAIVVSTTMSAGRPGVYAAGDIVTYPGKLPLIATGFGDAAVAVNQAVHWIYPDRKVNPAHSSNMALFGQSE